ncbi:D-glycero-alpha-D-manno-heptose 1-phosphate guanylyltransferase [Janthinobacterium sp. HH103]|uniref:NDP-sugar synthase n=1 Tax=Janthinobacterium agaricidamnosum TaxID=55508 RepID=A0A3G2E4U2_9BURK|nr:MULTISPECIES: NDP-sugar synthase [Janthinobacterium]AYM75313.1 NDP-sugar synthase [Janthinobacterium agaricidamnosum]OEZ67685.1 D-glycero-alpha-D-manno-heptose 1-phosphate guanylyltransferase [Janthinobacterium sp. HH103]OEZ73435.1 D-glycero-alpha-D-manno-heptose 1-phosphate guanylyltransferase [Janthinobacterium sp. HH100]OEZ96407.1 D-glycero-alpha-D-manno-heptose 1-phosphate guanylyltransferase [Janthinobacterium sp. HH107]QOU72357.1 UTP--glucose-1-phosphate uridylyltransferase [Janthinob
MKAMILAAGKGTRVRPLTYDLPKPMIPILGKPVMAYLVEHLSRYGITEIMVNVSYLHEKIEEYFGEGHQFGVQIGYSFEGYTNDAGEVVPEPLGSAGGMKKIQEFGNFFDETTIVLCGDALIDLDIKSALFEHRRKGALASVITLEVPWDKVSSYGVVVSDADGRIRAFQEKPAQADALSNCVSTGIYIFEPEVLELIPSDRPFDIGSELFPLLVEKGLPFYAQKRNYNWIDIGSVKDYWEVLQSVLMGEVAQLDVPGIQIDDGLWVGLNTSIDWSGGTRIEGPVYIGSGSRIEAGATIIGPTWIGHGSHVCAGAEVVRSVLFEYTRVLPGVVLDEMIVFKDYSVDRAGEMRHASQYEPDAWANARDRRNRRRAEMSTQLRAVK